MKIQHDAHLSYCTNIHAGEAWPDVFQSLKDYCLPLKASLSPDASFGIGLRLSNQSSEQLKDKTALQEFRSWLLEHDLYVFTMNGFPFGDFHFTTVKDKVHQPDWTTPERLIYSKHLFDILAQLLPSGLDGGVSTSPISYKYWHPSTEALEKAKSSACAQMIDLVDHLINIKLETGKVLHLDIEPEPDGILEDSAGFIDFYKEHLLKIGAPALASKRGIPVDQAEDHIRDHIQLCYDVCHFAVGFEAPEEVLDAIEAVDIGVGKIQISAALKAALGKLDQDVIQALAPFNESTYLHQVTLQDKSNQLTYYPDLNEGLEAVRNGSYQELRTHFHVPIFTEAYGLLQSTQDQIVETLQLWKKRPFTKHLEVETYTWEVLPGSDKLPLRDSIERELKWVRGVLK
ncbi:MAG: metabolite traffic protein EboE [Bacteroidota bacterium]